MAFKLIAAVLISTLISLNSSIAQKWTGWQPIQDGQKNLIDYSYRLNPVSSGNSFAIKLKSKYIFSTCGQFDILLTMVDGTNKKLTYMFDKLVLDKEKICYGAIEFADVQSFVSIDHAFLKDCGIKNNADSASTKASFIVEYHNEIARSGKFVYNDPTGEFSFETKASSGHLNAANNPHTQQYKDSPDPPRYNKKGKLIEGYGMIPSGTWFITSILDKQKMKLVLTPGPDVINPNGRGSFLIHGYDTDPADASTGCIILEPKYREKLMKAFLKYGKIELKIENKTY